MRISTVFNLNSGHSNFDFVDIDVTDGDTQLFIDPCLIETNGNDFCIRCTETMASYFDRFYHLYRTEAPESELKELFSHAHEINATKLGYGRGDNGKAKTVEGMLTTFSGVPDLLRKDIPLSKPNDLHLFIKNFAEDCMSDMLTNILFRELSRFTLEQCRKYSYPTQHINKKYHYWDKDSSSWKVYNEEALYINNELILLVPKSIVRHSYYYNVEQYFSSIIAQRKLTSLNTKKQIKEDAIDQYGDILTAAIYETSYTPDMLNDYHARMPGLYRGRELTDQKLDEYVYGERENGDL